MPDVRSPLPRSAISGTCDALGNATISNQVEAPSGFWAQIYIPIAASAGTPQWAVQLGATAALPLVFSAGQQSMLGPFLLLPGEKATLTVTGAAAGAVISGQSLGWQAEDPAELLPSTPITTALTAPALTAPNVLLAPVRMPVLNTNAVGGAALTFDVPEIVNALGAILYWKITHLPGGTIDFTISQHDANTGADQVVADSGAIAAGGTGTLAVYPGLLVSAGVSANQVVGHTPRVTITPAGGANSAGMIVWLDILP